MHTVAVLVAVAMMLGGTWAFVQSRAGTRWPAPIAVGGFVLLMLLLR